MLSTIGKIDTPLPASDAVVIGLLALIVVYGGTLWRIAGHAETVLHESAHVLTGIAAGRRIRGVNINTDGGGSTVMMPDSGFGVRRRRVRRLHRLERRRAHCGRS